MILSIEDLRWKIYNVFPAGELALDHLLGILSISYSTRIPTAAVKNEMPPCLLFNPEFIEKHCKTDEHLLMILMHEMYHVVLGHTRLFQLIKVPIKKWYFLNKYFMASPFHCYKGSKLRSTDRINLLKRGYI